MTLEIILQVETDASDIPEQSTLSGWVNHAANKLQAEIPDGTTEVTVCIVDEDQMAELNLNYRNKQGPTNVLSFPDVPMPGIASESLGDIALCASVVACEAEDQDKALEAHWAHLVIHGFLHLLGYDHLKESEAQIMESLEVEILKELGFPDPYV